MPHSLFESRLKRICEMSPKFLIIKNRDVNFLILLDYGKLYENMCCFCSKFGFVYLKNMKVSG